MRRLFLLLVIPFLAMPGCSIPDIENLDGDVLTTTNWARRGVTRWSFRRSADEAMYLDVAQPVGIDVESFNGDVHITVDPQLDQAKFWVVRQGTHGYLRRRESKASLSAIDYTVDLVPGELGQVMQIRTSTTDPEPHFQRANVHLIVPSVDGIRIRTSNGLVELINVEGAVDIRNDTGDVMVKTIQAMRDPVTIICTEGSIDYRVRGESTGALDAEVINGQVDHDIRYGSVRIQPGTDSDSLRASFNNGTNPIMLRTTDGQIRIAVVSNPMGHGQFIIK